MGDHTTIEWSDATWNPLRGCSKVSPGCSHCYAERVSARFSGPGAPYDGVIEDGHWNGEIRLISKHIDDPIRWRRPRRIFLGSMSDVFHPKVSDQVLDQLFTVMLAAPQHTYQVLTKRAERLARYTRDWCGRKPWPANIWLGVSVENQATADERIPHLFSTPAPIRFLSCEPLLGQVCLQRYMSIEWSDVCESWEHDVLDYARMLDGGAADRRLSWVIAGGESGPSSRPMHPNWLRRLREQCRAAHVAFFFKQWGSWAPAHEHRQTQSPVQLVDEADGKVYPSHLATSRGREPMILTSVSAAGAVLDNRMHREFPITPTTKATEP